MTHGTVTTYNTSSGFGYIAVDDGAPLFVDFTGLIGATVLRTGERVTFHTTPGVMGLHATQVRAAPTTTA